MNQDLYELAQEPEMCCMLVLKLRFAIRRSSALQINRTSYLVGLHALPSIARSWGQNSTSIYYAQCRHTMLWMLNGRAVSVSINMIVAGFYHRGGVVMCMYAPCVPMCSA